MTKEQFGGVLRAVLAAVAGYVAGAGWIDQPTADTMVGALGTLGIAIWSIVAKR